MTELVQWIAALFFLVGIYMIWKLYTIIKKVEQVTKEFEDYIVELKRETDVIIQTKRKARKTLLNNQ